MHHGGPYNWLRAHYLPLQDGCHLPLTPCSNNKMTTIPHHWVAPPPAGFELYLTTGYSEEGGCPALCFSEDTLCPPVLAAAGHGQL
ncbi:hypothetical protein GDO81_028284 [Engystomops pustulosus]|uniref:Uncharacterized protein n=1 Tax=Engystomops pustulosus TaxID=76066 RepID=A0AAV6YNF5_ENGPU|nr:hypothetical protein GDO81_028284 [Engystomops pustulosus]